MTREEMRATASITAEQGAAFLGCSVRHWYRLEELGTLPTHRMPSIGRMARWSGEVLAEFGTPKDIAKRRRAQLVQSA